MNSRTHTQPHTAHNAQQTRTSRIKYPERTTHTSNTKHKAQRENTRHTAGTQNTEDSTRTQRWYIDESLPLQINLGKPRLVGLRWYIGGSPPLQNSLGELKLVGLRWYTIGSLPLQFGLGDHTLVGLSWYRLVSANPKVNTHNKGKISTLGRHTDHADNRMRTQRWYIGGSLPLQICIGGCSVVKHRPLSYSVIAD